MNEAESAVVAAPSRPVKVGIYCWECGKVRALDGSPIGSTGQRSSGNRCGVDYGPDLLSHLVVWPVYALPPDSIAVIDDAPDAGAGDNRD